MWFTGMGGQKCEMEKWTQGQFAVVYVRIGGILIGQEKSTIEINGKTARLFYFTSSATFARNQLRRVQFYICQVYASYLHFTKVSTCKRKGF